MAHEVTGTDTMYHRWIAKLQSYKPWDIEVRKGIHDGNADGMSRFRRDCQYPKCETCKKVREKNEKCQDSDSVDSDNNNQGIGTTMALMCVEAIPSIDFADDLIREAEDLIPLALLDPQSFNLENCLQEGWLMIDLMITITPCGPWT